VSEGEGGHSCAVSNTFDAAYCWGRNDFGQLGDGAPRDGRVDSPQPVLGQP
jgi:alpha-tubulin suppressor-like RCC1 family protein